MKPEARRAKMLNRLARLRRIERMQALEEMSSANSEANRLAKLHLRSRSMLGNTSSNAQPSDGSALASSLAFGTQLAALAQSTEQLHGQAETKASHARERLQERERHLELVEVRAAEAAKALERKTLNQSAQSLQLARGLHSSKQIGFKPESAT